MILHLHKDFRSRSARAGAVALAFMLLSFAVASPALSAATCPNTASPATAQIAREFRGWVFSEYKGFGSASAEHQQFAFGHALGRVASAVQGDPEREIIFACLELAIEHAVARETWLNDLDQMISDDLPGQDTIGRQIFRNIMQAAMGMHDRAVYIATGVRDTSPAHAYFNALPPGTLAVPAPAVVATPTAPPQPAGAETEPEAETALIAESRHPWDGLCLPQLSKAGFRPIFGVWNDIGVRGPVIYIDPVANTEVEWSSADMCSRSAWDWDEFYGEFEWVRDRFLGHDEDQIFWKVVTWKAKSGGRLIWMRWYR